MDKLTKRVEVHLKIDVPDEYEEMASRWGEVTLQFAQDDILDRLTNLRELNSEISLVLECVTRNITLWDRICSWAEQTYIKIFHKDNVYRVGDDTETKKDLNND